MDLVIKIPKEFEEEFNRDKFEDSLARVASDIESFGFQLAGRYELETITMLRDAFKNGTPVPKGHGRLIDGDKAIADFANYGIDHIWDAFDLPDIIDESPIIIEADEEGE